MASEIDTYPNGRDTINMAGLKMSATIRNPAVVAYLLPTGV
jgi:hypothetical protein